MSSNTYQAPTGSSVRGRDMVPAMKYNCADCGAEVR